MAKGRYHEWLTEEGLLRIEGWARDGLTEEQIAHNMGVAVKTLYNWKNDHLPILQALKKGKEVVDRQVENALLKRALGYSYEEITEERHAAMDEEGRYIKDENGKVIYELIPVKKVIKEVAPDTTAQIFWLKNRKPLEWRDKQQVEHSGEMKHDMNMKPNLSKLSTQELKQLAAIIAKSSDTP